MPMLLVILGQELGLELHLAMAPEHFLVRFRNLQGRWDNVEATSFGAKADAAYQRELSITDTALVNGIFLRALDNREAAGAMLLTLMDHYRTAGKPLQRLQVADVLLALDPRNVGAMLGKGAAYYALLRERYRDRYEDAQRIPSAQHADFLALSEGNRYWFERATSMGWIEPPPLIARIVAGEGP